MKSFTALDSVTHEGQTNVWLTPRWLLDRLGEFDLDPCAAPLPRPWSTAKTMIGLPEDGLAAEWTGRVWLNPPYGKTIATWLRRLAAHGNGIALVFARTDTKWFHEIVRQADGVFFFEGRIRFCRPDGTESTNAGTGSCLICFGVENVAAVADADLDGLMVRMK